MGPRHPRRSVSRIASNAFIIAGFVENFEKTRRVIIFTDGACSGNPGPGGWAYLVYFIENNHIIEAGGPQPNTTNNQMEMEAAYQALKYVETFSGLNSIEIFSDSKYLIQGVTEWISGWKKKGWKKSNGEDVLNQAFWLKLETQINRVSGFAQIKWKYVPAHSGIPSNERVDKISVEFSLGSLPKLQTGSPDQLGYDPLADSQYSNSLIQKKNSNEIYLEQGKFQQPLYLTLIDGVLQEHKTWVECEQRVKGVRQAKYKKVKSQGEYDSVLKSWNYKADSTEG